MASAFGLEPHTKLYPWRDLGHDLGVSGTTAAKWGREILPDHMLEESGGVTKLRHEFRHEATQLIKESRAARPESNGVQILSYSEARAARETYEAEYSRLKLEEKRGELLNTRDVQRAYTDAVTTTTRRIQQVPDQLAAELVGLGADEIRGLLKKALNEALKQLHVEVRGVALVEE